MRLCVAVFVGLVVLSGVATAKKCPPASRSTFLPPLPMHRSTGSGVVQQCQFIDLNGDGNPDYVCAYSHDLREDACLRCVYMNTGQGFHLQSGHLSHGDPCYDVTWEGP